MALEVGEKAQTELVPKWERSREGRVTAADGSLETAPKLAATACVAVALSRQTARQLGQSSLVQESRLRFGKRDVVGTGASSVEKKLVLVVSLLQTTKGGRANSKKSSMCCRSRLRLLTYRWMEER